MDNALPPEDYAAALQVAAQCWCDVTTEHLVMEPALAEAFARRLAAQRGLAGQYARQVAAWMDTARQSARDVAFYQGLLDACGAALGDAARVADDGSVADAPLRGKVPELVASLVEENRRLRRLLALAHDSSTHRTYGDDGELSCGACRVDFVRDPVRTIEEKLAARAMFELKAAAARGDWPPDAARKAVVDQGC